MIKVAAFLIDTTLFCIKSSDIKGIYSISNAHRVIGRNDLFCHTCYSSLLQETYYVYNWKESQSTMQGCFLLDFKVVFPFDSLVGVFDIDSELLKGENPSLFEVQSKARISIKETNHAVQLLNTLALPSELLLENEYTDIASINASQVQKQLEHKTLIAHTPKTELSVPYEFILKIVYRPTLMQRYPIKSEILGRFAHSGESFESVCLDNTDAIYDYHIHLRYEGQEYVLNCEDYSVHDEVLNDKEYTNFKSIISQLPPSLVSFATKKSDSAQHQTEEDFVFYKSTQGTCAVEAHKISKIVLNNREEFSIILLSGVEVPASRILGVHKSQVTPCHGLINNKIVLRHGMSAFYPIE